jgi:hypothetical protein
MLSSLSLQGVEVLMVVSQEVELLERAQAEVLSKAEIMQ